MNNLIILAALALIVWVARINYMLAKARKANESLSHDNRKLAESNRRFQILVSKIEKNQIESKIVVEKFITSLDNAKYADDFNKLLEEAFGSLVNRQNVGTRQGEESTTRKD